MTDHRLGLLLVALSTVAWSTAGLFIRAITEDLFTVLVWLAYGETPALATLAGAIVVFAAVIWHIVRQTRAARVAAMQQF